MSEGFAAYEFPHLAGKLHDNEIEKTLAFFWDLKEWRFMTEEMTCNGFQATGIAAGIKKNGQRDLGLIYSKVPAAVAGVFTQNKVMAAPVMLDRERVQGGLCQAIIVNSGNANCCTGKRGLTDAKAMAAEVALELGIADEFVLVSSTGVIGQSLPVEKIKNGIPALVASLSPNGFHHFAAAIMTTDTFPKIILRKSEMDGKSFSMIGIAKGAGMISPNMATMLCFVLTDAEVNPAVLKDSLSLAAERSFNRITIDGDTSTNDTILIMANGLSGATVHGADQKETFQRILDDVLVQLAKLVVRDGEGATKFVEILVRGALTHEDARKVASTVANSNLVKTAFFGEDANWGRILGAAGRAGVSMEQDRVDVYFDDVLMVENGVGRGETAEADATRILRKPEFAVLIDLKMGDGCASVFTCDFSVDYVKINADYRS